MRALLSFVFIVVACGTLSSFAAAQITTISHDRFEYSIGGFDGESGGVGWENAWWTGGGADHAVIDPGGCDGFGNQARTNVSDQGAYRAMALGWHTDVTDPAGGGLGQPVLGRDGTSVWTSFCIRGVGNDQYGGVSLFNQGVGEGLFIGSPAGTLDWGVHVNPTGGGPIHVVPNTDVTTQASLACRIDFGFGPERLRLWVDPAVPHPDSLPDLDVTIGDFRFNELRLQSGLGTGLLGYEIDDLHIEKDLPVGSTLYCDGDGSSGPCGCGNESVPGEGCANSLGVGGTLASTGQLSWTNDTFAVVARQVPDKPGVFFCGTTPLGPGLTFGDGLRCISGNVIRLSIVQAAGGCASTDQPAGCGTELGGLGGPVTANPGNANLMPGDRLNFQYWYRDPGPSNFCQDTFFNLTIALESTVEQ